MFNRLLAFIKRLWSSKLVQFFSYFLLSFILLEAIGGLIGNSTYAGTPPAWLSVALNQVSKVVITNFLIITSLISLISVILLFIFLNRYINLNKVLKVSENLDNLDASLLRLLTNLLLDHKVKSKVDLEKEIRRLLYELLRDATKAILGQQSKGRGAILFLTSPNDEYLRVVASHRLSLNTVSRMNFYIGKDETKDEERGTVGIAYMTRQICVAHISQKKGYCECDDDNFINFDEGRLQLPYQTFVNIPIIGLVPEGSSDCLGILCLDTRVSNAFDSQRTKLQLQTIANRVAVALSIYLLILHDLNYSFPYFN